MTLATSESERVRTLAVNLTLIHEQDFPDSLQTLFLPKPLHLLPSFLNYNYSRSPQSPGLPLTHHPIGFF